ncbi:hypothetical protein [Plesiocystis pacifica]|uniref:hypothetical protein n=1 Tax=Plesiocystis pacifica TaxID=191768 RepID=UPI0012F82DC0|nr:hypothetical protein [Plesiocystis pacifica]
MAIEKCVPVLVVCSSLLGAGCEGCRGGEDEGPRLSESAEAGEGTQPVELPEGYDWELKLGEHRHDGEPTLVEIDAREQELTEAYFEYCNEAVGEFPVDEFSCEDAQLMPVTGLENHGDSLVRGDAGSVPHSLDGIASCDRPSLIYRDMHNIGCSEGSRIKRISKGDADWVYVCRKANEFFSDEHLYSEIGLIGHNRETGATCFYAGRAAVKFKVEGEQPGKDGPVTVKGELSALLGKGMHAPNDAAGVRNWAIPDYGGCARCHSHGPWLNFPFVDGKNDYSELKYVFDDEEEMHMPEQRYGERQCSKSGGEAGSSLPEAPGYHEDDCEPVVPERHPGMLYAPVNPASALASQASGLEPKLSDDEKKRYEWPEARRLKPEVKDAGVCTTCHHIGNETYSERYPRALFSSEPSGAEPNRVWLYQRNTTESLRSSHRSKVETLTWASMITYGIPGYGTGGNGELPKLDDAQIEAAVMAIEGCKRAERGSEDWEKCWANHWTGESLAADPLQYLQDTCSYCHSGEAGPKVPKLVTEAEFKASASDICSRLKDERAPHPPGGQLSRSILDILDQSELLSCKTESQ